jgi:Myb-like DNA-binding protein FlbD
MNRRRRLVLRWRRSSQCPNHSDERAQLLSFAGPTSKHALTISSSNYSSRGGMDGSLLPPPAVSEASRAGSVKDSLSIVSVNGLSFSVLPQLTTSPSLELPPLNAFGDARRPSLPMPQFRPNVFHSETDRQALAFSSCFHDEHESHGLSSLSPSPPVYRRPEKHAALPHSPRYYHYDSCGQPLTPPSTPLQLAPLLMSPQSERPEQSGERDTWVHLSSLLG